MRHYTKGEWEKEQYKDRWDDCPYFRDMASLGEIQAEYIGRRAVMVNDHDRQGCKLLTEGVHFTVDDDEGRKYMKEKINR